MARKILKRALIFFIGTSALFALRQVLEDRKHYIPMTAERKRMLLEEHRRQSQRCGDELV